MVRRAVMAELLYDTSLRLMECVQLRVKDIDFPYRQITVQDGKGAQNRVTMLPLSLQQPLQHHLVKVQPLHEKELREQGTERVHASHRPGTPAVTCDMTC